MGGRYVQGVRHGRSLDESRQRYSVRRLRFREWQMKATGFLFWVALLACSTAAVFSAEPGNTLKLVSTIPLPGVKGRFDHFAIDTNTHHLFVAALGNNTLEILDVAAAKRVHTIPGLHKPTGVVFL